MTTIKQAVQAVNKDAGRALRLPQERVKTYGVGEKKEEVADFRQRVAGE